MLHWGESFGPGIEGGALAPEPTGPGGDGGPHQEIQGDIDDPAIFRLFQKTALCPLVKGAHAGAAPDLVVHSPIRLPNGGPPGG